MKDEINIRENLKLKDNHDKTFTVKIKIIKLSPTNPEEELVRKKHLEEADQVGEDEEGSGVVDPLEEAEEDEGAPVDDEPRWEDRLHPPY